MRRNVIFWMIITVATIFCSSCNRWDEKPFLEEDVENIEIYRCVSVPVSAEKKEVTDSGEIHKVCRRIFAAGAPDNPEESAVCGGETISFRVHLIDGTECEITYGYEKSDDLSVTVWDEIEQESVPVQEDELP